MAEAYGHINILMKYFGSAEVPATHFPFNFQITLLNKYLDASQMIDNLNDWLKNLPKGAASNWAVR